MRYLPRYYTKVKVTGSIRRVNTVVYIDTDTRIIDDGALLAGRGRKAFRVLFEEFVRATRRLSLSEILSGKRLGGCRITGAP
jgi:hypothetical protein